MILMYPAWRARTYIFICSIEFLPWMGTLSSCIIVSGRISHTSQWQWHPEGASESSTIIARLLYLQEALRSSILVNIQSITSILWRDHFVSLKSWTFTTKVLIAVVAIIISLILFIVGFLLVLMSGLHKIKFCYSLAISCSWHICTFTTGLPHFLQCSICGYFSHSDAHLSHITKAVFKKYLHYLIFVLIIALSNDINQHNLDCTLLQ
jgi:hypothetical protein